MPNHSSGGTSSSSEIAACAAVEQKEIVATPAREARHATLRRSGSSATIASRGQARLTRIAAARPPARRVLFRDERARRDRRRRAFTCQAAGRAVKLHVHHGAVAARHAGRRRDLSRSTAMFSARTAKGCGSPSASAPARAVHHVRAADEARDERRARPRVQLARRRQLLDAPWLNTATRSDIDSASP